MCQFKVKSIVLLLSQWLYLVLKLNESRCRHVQPLSMYELDMEHFGHSPFGVSLAPIPAPLRTPHFPPGTQGRLMVQRPRPGNRTDVIARWNRVNGRRRNFLGYERTTPMHHYAGKYCASSQGNFQWIFIVLLYYRNKQKFNISKTAQIRNKILNLISKKSIWNSTKFRSLKAVKLSSIFWERIQKEFFYFAWNHLKLFIIIIFKLIFGRFRLFPDKNLIFEALTLFFLLRTKV